MCHSRILSFFLLTVFAVACGPVNSELQTVEGQNSLLETPLNCTDSSLPVDCSLGFTPPSFFLENGCQQFSCVADASNSSAGVLKICSAAPNCGQGMQAKPVQQGECLEFVCEASNDQDHVIFVASLHSTWFNRPARPAEQNEWTARARSMNRSLLQLVFLSETPQADQTFVLQNRRTQLRAAFDSSGVNYPAWFVAAIAAEEDNNNNDPWPPQSGGSIPQPPTPPENNDPPPVPDNGNNTPPSTPDNGNSNPPTPPADNDPARGPVSFLGDPIVGQRLLARPNSVVDNDGINYSTESFQWYRDGFAIAGATSESYTLGASDTCTEVHVRYSYIDNRGTPESKSSPAELVAPLGSFKERVSTVPASFSVNPADSIPGNNRPRGRLVFLGTPEVGETVTARPNGITDADGINRSSASFQWYRNTTLIPGATNQTYQIQAADNLKELRVKWTFSDNAGHEEVITSLFKYVEPQIHPCDLR